MSFNRVQRHPSPTAMAVQLCRRINLLATRTAATLSSPKNTFGRISNTSRKLQRAALQRPPCLQPAPIPLPLHLPGSHWKRPISTTNNNVLSASTMLAADSPVIERIPDYPARPPTDNKPLTPATARSAMKTARPTSWTLEANSLIMELVGQGYSWRLISEIIGRSLSGCRRHYRDYLAPFSIMPQTAESRAGSFSDLDLIKKRVQERKNWRQIAEELGQPAQDLRVRYYALEPWLKEGMGHRSSAVRAQLLSGFAKNVDDIFEAMVQDESGLSLETVQGWYDRALVRADRARHRVSGMRVEPLPRVIRMVESQLHKHKRIERYYTGQDWTQLLGLTSRTLSVKKWKRLQLKWLTQNSAWSDRAETLLIQQVLRRGVGAWDDIATALNTDARMNIKDKREKPSRIFTPAECSIHWKNLDMPVQRAFDSREWTAPTKQAFWLAWSRRNKERKDRIMGGPGGDQQFWNIVADDMRMPGGGEQCLVYFEDSIQGLSTLDDRGISDHADQQVQDAREKSSRQVISLRPKHWSLVLQDLVRKADIKQGRIYSTPGEVGGWKAVVDQIREYERSSKQWTLDEAVNKTTFDGVLWHWRRIHRQSGPPWSQSELKLLEQGIRECGYHWKVICQRYLPWRTSTMMRPRWYLLPDCAARITVEEYETLLQAVGEQRRQARVGSVSVDDVDWSRIAARMPGWSADPCRRVYESSFRFLMEQTKFTAEEDQWLLQNISSEKDQSQNWKAAVDHFPASGISAWQYRLRWCQLTDAAVP